MTENISSKKKKYKKILLRLLYAIWFLSGTERVKSRTKYREEAQLDFQLRCTIRGTDTRSTWQLCIAVGGYCRMALLKKKG
jgi:hypothetical protein